MSAPLPHDRRYARRRADCRLVNLTIDEEAFELLARYATHKRHGSLVSRLLYEHHARQQERARRQQGLQSGQEEEERTERI